MEFNVNMQYPRSEKFEYESYLKRVNLDLERRKDVSSGHGFIVSSPKAIKDDIKDPNGIYSSRFGQTLEDLNPFSNRYKCKCGHLNSRIYHGIECPICHTKVEYVDDDFSYFGWIVLKDPYVIIHPNLYKAISFLIGSEKLLNILMPDGRIDQDGNPIDMKPTKEEPFRGIGMLEFHERFDEVINYYALKFPNKKSYWDDLIENRANIFSQSIPVYTTLLRPYRIEGGTFHFEDTNATYNIMAKLAAVINHDNLKIFRKEKPKDQLLYDLQCKIMELYESIMAVISGKKGQIRSSFGGRYNFSSRSVIVPGPKLGIDQVKLGYTCLCGLLQQVIINILHKSYNMTYEEAYKTLFYESMAAPNPRIVNIIKGLIKDSGQGIPIIINRNPGASVSMKLSRAIYQ